MSPFTRSGFLGFTIVFLTLTISQSCYAGLRCLLGNLFGSNWVAQTRRPTTRVVKLEGPLELGPRIAPSGNLTGALLFSTQDQRAAVTPGQIFTVTDANGPDGVYQTQGVVGPGGIGTFSGVDPNLGDPVITTTQTWNPSTNTWDTTTTSYPYAPSTILVSLNGWNINFQPQPTGNGNDYNINGLFVASNQFSPQQIQFVQYALNNLYQQDLAFAHFELNTLHQYFAWVPNSQPVAVSVAKTWEMDQFNAWAASMQQQLNQMNQH